MKSIILCYYNKNTEEFMKEIYLPLTYSINAAEIFLNIFNLRLKIDDIEQILPNYTIEVWDSNKKKGTLTFQNYQFQIQANTPFGTLVANSNLPRRMRIPDDEVNESLDTWDHIVKFSIKSQNESCEMNGEVRLVCNDDTEYGSSCSCHSTFALTKKSNETQQDEKIEMCFLRNGSTFSCYYQTPNHREKILVSPLTFSTLFMEHDKWDYNSREYASVFEDGTNHSKLITLQIKDEGGNNTFWNRQSFDRDPSQKKKENTIQKGQLMQAIDPNYLNAIERFRKYLQVDNVSLLDNLISVSLDSYSDNEIQALMGTTRRKIAYHESAPTLNNFYYSVKDSKVAGQEHPKILTLKNNL